MKILLLVAVRTIFQLFSCWFLFGLLIALGTRFGILHHLGYAPLGISGLLTETCYLLIIVAQNLFFWEIYDRLYFRLLCLALGGSVPFFCFPFPYLTPDSPLLITGFMLAIGFSTSFISSALLTTLLFYNKSYQLLLQRN